MLLKGYSEFEWEVRDAKSGDKTLLLGGRAVYSSYNPVKQTNILARKLIEEARNENCDQIIIIGLGLGYQARALYDAGFTKILVWEPFPVMQKSFPVCDGDWRRGVIVVNERDKFEKAAIHFAVKGSKPKLIIHPGYDIFCRLEHRFAVQILDRIYNTGREELFVVSQRSLESLIRLPFLGTLKEFEGAYTGRRAILASPGPSLKQCVHALSNTGDIIVFASLQAAPYLQKNGVRVHYLVCADPQDMSPFTAECNDDFDAFFAETSADPGTLDWKRNRTFLFHFKCGQVHEKLWGQCQLPMIEEPCSSVSEVMLLLADYMGFTEIYCLGMDFCWKEERYTYRTNDKYRHDSQMNLGSCFNLDASDSRIATTLSVYFHGARFMQHKCSELDGKGKRIYQTEGGLMYAPAGVLTVDELEKRIHSGNCGGTVRVIKPQAPVTVEQVEQELHEIKSGWIKSRPTHEGAGKNWPFLQGMSSEELSKACDKSLDRLTGLQHFSG